MKKIVIALILVCTLAFFAACGGKQGGASYEVIQYLPGDPPTKVEPILNAINPYLEKKIGAKVKFVFVPWDQYSNKLITITTAGEQIDTAATFQDILGYKDYMSRGGVFADISKDLPKYAPDLYKLYSPDIWDQVNIGGKIGTIPIINAFSIGWRFNADLVKKYNFDVSTVKTTTDLEPMLAKVVEGEQLKNLAYGDDWHIPYDLTKYYPVLGRNLPWVIDQEAEGKPIVVNVFEQSEAVKRFRDMRYLEEKAYVMNGDYARSREPMHTKGTWFVGGLGIIKPDLPYNEHWGPGGKGNFAQQATPHQAFIYPDFFHSVFQNSGNIPKTLAYLNAVFTDPKVSYVLTWGLENTHWQKIDDKHIKILPTRATDAISGGEWMFKIWGNPINLLVEGAPDNLFMQEQEALKNARRPVLGPFAPDISSIKTEVASISAIVNQYLDPLERGLKDTDPMLKELNTKLKAAGYDKVAAELQKQIDAFLASKK